MDGFIGCDAICIGRHYHHKFPGKYTAFVGSIASIGSLCIAFGHNEGKIPDPEIVCLHILQ